ncbi:ABC transporter ATP-binding protein [Aquabacterium sp. J223]|uniref:ABC transporter ATP-binding protein n=1 Tax=Aquabacterium sp. J223 TaxID=2898431 RepID=UPI0021AE0A9A|nr:ABC transporter ATP-binding protein [Aquabacterium sp. J223]UUX96068.1 ABC transporter ATP-binding protein [Aquabacterium sp. J223]
MALIELDLAHSYKPRPQADEDYALLPLRMRFRDGGAYALLGPSGCGKSTLLNIVSGLVAPSQGSLRFDGVDVTRRSPQQRNIAQVFQFPVIYDTMTVAQNLAFPLKNRGVAPDRIRARVGRIAEMLELSGELDRRAAQLSADQKQKISLGRGLVREDVSAVLFDEPLTVIDPHLKWQLRRKLKQIHQELKLTLIYVTHDQVEALTFAEEVVVMTRGRAVQVGDASALFERPEHRFVGHFIGSPGMNFLPAAVADGAVLIAGRRLGAAPPELASHAGGFTLGIRPEHLALAEAGAPGAAPARVQRLQDLGTSWLLTAELEGGQDLPPLRARLPGEAAVPAVGQAVWLPLLGPHTRCYGADERLIAAGVPST